ncbi:PD-(D/E)XK nuclease family protein [Paenibacillus pasadenensis]|uniref:PD-(D/E)XK nuclease family protein n=1 Tax=Paenibacillus pasadenensis TaxID=217090 RepID=UPI0003FE3DE3|nr:PD-(D/E)XK nuclease family protein [Paenibacillus pasadenensis]
MSGGWSRELVELSRRDPFRRKIVLGDRFQQAEQWLARAAAEAGPLLGMEPGTLRSAAARLAQPELAARGLRLLGSGETLWLVQAQMQRLAEAPDAYAGPELLTPGIIEAFHDAVQELRLAGVSSAALREEAFVDARKGRYMRELLAGYEQALQAGGCQDFAGLLELLPEAGAQAAGREPADPAETRRRAAEGRDAGTPGGAKELYIVPSLDGYAPVERRMLERIAGSGMHVLGACEAFPACLEGRAAGRGGISMFRAAGKLAEAREALRRLLGAELPLDRAEIVIPPDSGCEGAVQSLCDALGLPATYAAGRHVSQARAGRAALALLDWAGGGYGAESLAQALRHGSISLRAWSEELGSGELARALEELGWGRERYERLAVEGGAERADPSAAHGGPLGASAASEAQARARGVLAAVFRDLLAWLPEPSAGGWTPLTVLRGLNAFLAAAAVVASEEDAAVLAELQAREQELERVPLPELSAGQALRFVRGLVLGIRIGASGPQAGKLHVSTLPTGAESGRPMLFLLGMSDSAWSSSVRQDPVLLDSERAAIGGLLLSGERAERAARERALRLGRLGEGTALTLSWSCSEPGAQAEIEPAYELLQAARVVSGQPELDRRGLERWLGGPAGYEASPGGPAIDAADRWLQRLAGAEPGSALPGYAPPARLRSGLDALARAYPSVASRLEAARATAQDRLSEHEGMLRTGRFPIRYGTGEEGHLSVTQLERYADCPKRFFYSTILKIRAKDAPELDRTRWLDAGQKGDLLHRLYQLYLAELADRAGSGPLAHDEALLGRLTEQVLREFQAAVPAPSPAIRAKESEAIRRDAAVFYRSEQGRAGRPKFFELELQQDGEPMPVVLASGLTMRVKGFIDRIDQLAPHRYKIYDYKTGNPRKYDENGYFAGGRQLQHALYAVAAEQYLRRTGIDPEAVVVESAYCFPTERGLGKEISRTQDRRGELAELTGLLLSSIEAGAFPALPADERACGWCDYREACGREAETARAKKQLPDNEALIRQLREAENYA